MDVIVVFLVRDGNVAVQRVDSIGRCATRFSWMGEFNLGVDCVLLIAYENECAAMLTSSKILFKFSCFYDALLVHAQ